MEKKATVVERWCARDRFGREVVLTEIGWKHILDRQPGMVETEQEIRLTLESPDRVMHDADHADRENHYRRISRRTSMKAVVA